MLSSKDITFDGQRITIEYASPEIEPLLEFLFSDLTKEEITDQAACFTIEQDSDNKNWTLTRNGTKLFQGPDLNGMGNILSGEVLFSLIENNQKAIAIHAGLVSKNGQSILLPADSGSGKSSVTTWLLTQGWSYHTDELVMVNLKTDRLKAFTRPINIKASGLATIGEIFDLKFHRNELRSSNMVTMIPHQLVNAHYDPEISELHAMVFPKYSADIDPGIQRISGAEAGLELMRSNVIARNLPGHGFADVISLVRKTPAYRLHYQHFENLKSLFADIAA